MLPSIPSRLAPSILCPVKVVIPEPPVGDEVSSAYQGFSRSPRSTGNTPNENKVAFTVPWVVDPFNETSVTDPWPRTVVVYDRGKKGVPSRSGVNRFRTECASLNVVLVNHQPVPLTAKGLTTVIVIVFPKSYRKRRQASTIAEPGSRP